MNPGRLRFTDGAWRSTDGRQPSLAGTPLQLLSVFHRCFIGSVLPPSRRPTGDRDAPTKDIADSTARQCTRCSRPASAGVTSYCSACLTALAAELRGFGLSQSQFPWLPLSDPPLASPRRPSDPTPAFAPPSGPPTGQDADPDPAAAKAMPRPLEAG